MKSITIHGLDGPLDTLIREKARRQQLSLNKTIKLLLEESLGLTGRGSKNHRDEFIDLFGVWTTEDKSNFIAANKELNSIDPGEWI